MAIKIMKAAEVLRHEQCAVIRRTNGEFTRCIAVFVREEDAKEMADSLNSADRAGADFLSYEVVHIDKSA